MTGPNAVSEAGSSPTQSDHTPGAHPAEAGPLAGAQAAPESATVAETPEPVQGEYLGESESNGEGNSCHPNPTHYTDAAGNRVAFGSAEAAEQERETRRRDRGHVFHSWSAQNKINPMPIAHAEGAWIFDYAGNAYLDLASQLVSANLGHAHPDLVAALQRQATRVTNLNPAFANDLRGQVAETITDRAQGDFSHVFFTNGGADAIEHAIRLARLHTGKSKILTAYRSYHGATGSAIMATGEPRRHGNPTTDGDIKHFWGPFLYRTPFHATTEEEECERALSHLEQTLIFEGDVAAVLVESMVGSSGVIAPPDGYLAGVRDICDRHGAVWIADEVMVGFGRTGRMFAYEHGGCARDGGVLQPDLVTFAKGVNSGVVPFGGVMMTQAVADTFGDRPYPGGLTYSGHPLGAAVAVAAQEVYQRDHIFDHVADIGSRVIGPALAEIAAKHPSVGNVRGRGFFWAIELVADHDSKEPLGAEAMKQFASECKAGGVWPMVSGSRTHIAPPLITTEAEVRQALEVVDSAIDATDRAL
ncbi:aminotransferase class III-fold pyridoxal phosphate-dependent enzyme [Corynebacterium heidelbergense]|uniref:Aspartate aminotransferase family protein n=1 Tax=Corynebacterium heidelbergense TaxID=2055947 RepID=A0A364VDD7_9CORY|nr:aminotransferase class III-fold pyridoxal phosphate-dependent enzyme [Corynebacterium heidelbergense]RAV34672.1 aspartate aminotransferase family protein [Corynebacterium heidelbergense]WCZ36244.1 Taurine--pyruvate aminotransferase [Corynebacterium heidelbergense]